METVVSVDTDMLTRLSEFEHTPFAEDKSAVVDNMTPAEIDDIVAELLARQEQVPVARFGSAI